MTLLRSACPGDGSRRIGLAVIAVALAVVFSARHPRYGSVSNFETIGVNLAPTLIAAVGTMALLLAGHLDLSIGSMYGLCAVSVAQVAHGTQSTWLALLSGVVFGVVLGAFSGLAVRMLSISPIIVTIGLLAVYRGLAYVVSGGVSVYGFPKALMDVGRGRVLGIPVAVLVAAVVFAAGSFLLTRTVPGLRIYAIGGNRRAAELNGVRASSLIHWLYVINGALIGITAALTVARISSADPNLGLQFELDVITAVILGGIAFTGGNGRPIGVVLGVAVLGLLSAGLVFEGLADQYQQIAKGGILLLALGADQYRRSSRRRGPRLPALSGLLARRAAAATGAESLAQPHGRAQAPGAVGELGTNANAPWIVEGVGRSFGPVVALRDVSFVARPGQVTCLLGDNGAGKSTIVRILSGAERPDRGTVRHGDVLFRPRGPGGSRREGVETVYQDLALCTNLSSTHNLMLGAEPIWGPRWLRVRDDDAGAALVDERLARLGVVLPDKAAVVGGLSGGQRQALAIARALHDGVTLACFDEPTAALGVTQTARVLDSIRAVAAQGAAVIVITHDIATVRTIADHLMILRLGEVIFEGPPSDLTEHEILHLMGGARDVKATAALDTSSSGDALVSTTFIGGTS